MTHSALDPQAIEALHQEVITLRNEKLASEAQRVLLTALVTMAQTSTTQGDVIKGALQKAVDLVADFTAAEKGSLFLMDPATRRVTDALLSRTAVTPEIQARLINSVLDKGLAGWVIRHRQLGLITDTETDDRWITLPDQPYVARSALAVPVIQGDELVGIITLLHSVPHQFTPEHAALIQTTADQIALVLENARLYAKLDRYSSALDEEIEKGRKMQLDFLPYDLVTAKGWDIMAFSYPAKRVGGDFYDTFCLGDDIALVIADVCDKGVGSALFMALFRSLLRVFAEASYRGASSKVVMEAYQIVNGKDGKETRATTMKLSHLNALQAIERANSYVAENHWQLNMFATIFFGVLDPKTGLLSYVSGGHEPLYVVGTDGKIKQQLDSTGPAVGMMPGMIFKVGQVRLEVGDIVVGYTDGVTEGKNPDGKLFGDQALRSLIEAAPAASATELLERVKSALFAYIDDAVQFDDITMIGVQRQA